MALDAYDSTDEGAFLTGAGSASLVCREASRPRAPAADQHPLVLDQTVLADFIVEDHFARHLRRLRVVYRERLEAMADAAGPSQRK